MSATCSPRPLLASSACPAVSSTSSESRSDASDTQKTPSGKRSDASAAACRARRVLPVPPGPVSVNKPHVVPPHQREHLRQLTLTAQKRGRGDRQVRPVQALQRRKLFWAELVDPLGVGEILQPVHAQVAQAPVGKRAAVEADTSTCPPWPQAAIRAARCTSTPTYPSSSPVRRSGVDAHPNPDRTPRETCHRLGGGRERTRRGREGDEEGVSLRVHLNATVCVERTPQDTAVRGERLGILSRAQVLGQPCRALNIGEQEAHGSGREIAIHGRMMRQRAVCVTGNVPRGSRRSSPARSSRG